MTICSLASYQIGVQLMPFISCVSCKSNSFERRRSPILLLLIKKRRKCLWPSSTLYPLLGHAGSKCSRIYQNGWSRLSKQWVMSPFLFIIGIEALTLELRTGYPWEPFRTDYLALIAITLDELECKLSNRKKFIERKGSGINMKKTKDLCSCTEVAKTASNNVKFLSGIWEESVGANSIFYEFCDNWIHKRCSNIHDRLSSPLGFKCQRCQETLTKKPN